MASTPIRPDLVDHALGLYCDWRAACAALRDAYDRFSAAPRPERQLAFAAYTAALDQEGAASELYAEAMRRTRPEVPFSPAYRPASESLS